MTLLLSLFPLYIFGNLHCVGMCGPLVMMIGQNKFRYFYFFGRLTSYSLVGWIAGEAGALVQVFLHQYYIPALACFFFGGIILFVGLQSLFGWHLPRQLFQWMAPMNRSLSLLILRDQPWPVFLFGFFTVALPCGQTIVVFSACALYGSGWAGLLNGFVFALMTSPSLYAAMHAYGFIQKARKHYNTILGYCSLFVGILAICRGLAEMGWINHLIIYPHYHLVIY